LLKKVRRQSINPKAKGKTISAPFSLGLNETSALFVGCVVTKPRTAFAASAPEIAKKAVQNASKCLGF